jgi:hypothetical protein
MLDRLRARSVNANPPKLQKIRPAVSVHDFRKYQPTIVRAPVNSKPAPTQPKTVQYAQPVAKAMPVPPMKRQARTVLPQVVAAPVKPAGIVSPPPNRPVSSPRSQAGPKIIRVPYPARSSTPNGIKALKGSGTGKLLVMVAAGPSVNEINFSAIKGHPLIDVMCINQPHKDLWPVKYWAFCDHSQYRRNISVWDGYDGTIINSTNVRARKSNQFVLDNIRGKGFVLDVSHGYHIGRSSTYANMQVAYHMGYEKIYIFGCDMAEVNGVLHYYGQNPDVPNERRKQRFADEADNYNWAAQNLAEPVRQRFVFCSNYNPWPFVNRFGRLDHTTAVDEIVRVANTLQK